MGGGARKRRPALLDPAQLADPASVRPPGGAVVDLHAHSMEHSLDSGVSAEKLASQAAARGLDGICLTDHNAIWPAAALRELSERHGVAVLPAMELGTDIGHVLVFGLDRFVPELLMIDRLRAVVRSEEAAMVLAHPMRVLGGRTPSWEEIPDWFEALEAINGDHSDSEHGQYVRLAASLSVAGVGGSDAHTREAVGRVGTAFPEPVADVGTLVRLLRAGQATAVDLRPRTSLLETGA